VGEETSSELLPQPTAVHLVREAGFRRSGIKPLDPRLRRGQIPKGGPPSRPQLHRAHRVARLDIALHETEAGAGLRLPPAAAAMGR
jgi:hypothetical protein